jgi:hypothetical protein
MSTHTLTPITSINPSQLKDDVVEKITSAGFTLKEYETLQHQLAYRKSYNQRPEVVERRKLYTAKRNLKMKMLKSLLQQ